VPFYSGHLEKTARGNPASGQILLRLPAYDATSFAGRRRYLYGAVLYRYHYWKALGNLLGLSQLLYFVAKETGLGVGPLVCHSTYAVLDTEGGGRIGDVKQFVADCLK
jgi:hypothetical protein